MSRGVSQKWKAWRSNVTTLAESLALKFGLGELPIPLREIARSRRVKEVAFRPLAIDGCTAVEDDGFVMYVRCEEGKIEDWNRRWNDTDNGECSLPGRTRFTIAHEIIHTFFFDTKGSSLRSRVNLKHSGTRQSIERECNTGASRLLLPEPFLQAEARMNDLLDPTVLVALRARAAISASCLVNRLKGSKAWSDSGGTVVYVREENGEFQIEDIAMHPVLNCLFPHVTKGQFLKDIIDCSALTLCGGTERKVVVEVPAQVGARKAFQRCVVACDHVYKTNKSYFVTIREEGTPRLAANDGVRER